MATPFQITVDCVDAESMAEFWAHALGYVPKPPPDGFQTWAEFANQHQIDAPAPDAIRIIVDPADHGPPIKFVSALTERQTDPGFNFEVRPGDEAAKDSLIAELTERGGRHLMRHREADGWWALMSDPEGNEFCVL